MTFKFPKDLNYYSLYSSYFPGKLDRGLSTFTSFLEKMYLMGYVASKLLWTHYIAAKPLRRIP